MGSFKNIGVKDYFKRYGIKNALIRGIFTTCPIHIVRDYEIKKILYYHKVKRRLKKKYQYACDIIPEGISFANIEFDNPMWVYWNQGIENAPEIVKTCINSVKENAQQKVVFLTSQNMNEYVTFPDYIEKKKREGNISAAAYSDILRYSLLEHYGGTWIDATVFLTGMLPKYITDSDFFVYRDVFGLIENPALFPSWLIHAKKNNKIILAVRNTTFEYWKHENHVIEYLLPYMFATIALESNEEEYKKLPYANSDYCHLLLDELGNQYDKDKFEHIKLFTNVHKLSYKLNQEVVEQDGTYYKYLLKENVQCPYQC